MSSLHSRYYVHTNHQGNVIALTDNSGTIVQRYEYDSFGNPYIITASGTGSISLVSVASYTGSLHENSRLYTGREYDKETGLYFLRARYYDARTGKFISRDPIGQNDQINLYTYVANSPLMYTDLWGLEKILIITGYISDDPLQRELFKATSDYLVRQAMANGSKLEDIIQINGAISIEEFNEKVKQYLGDIREVIYLTHGLEGNSVGEINKGNVSNLNSLIVDSNDDPLVKLISCQAGKGGSESIAQDMSNELGSTVLAANTDVISNITIKDLEDNNFEHSYGQPYLPKGGYWRSFSPNVSPNF